MADIAQLERALRNADAAGDTAAAQRFSAEIRKQRQASPQAQPSSPEEPGILSRVGEAITGSERMTPEIEGMREVTGAPELGGLPEFSIAGLEELYERGVTPEAFRSAAGLLATADPERQAQIIKSNYPGATFRTDEKGNVIVGLESGEYVLNAPGFSASDAQRLVGQMAAFTPAGRAATIPGAALAAGATEAGLQAGALGAGAEDIDPTEIAIATGLGGLGKGIEDIVSAVSRYRRGAISPEAQEVIRRGEEAGAPVMTTDVVPPETLAGRLARSTGETIPFAGTGPQRAAQQQAREAIVEEAVEGISPRHAEVVESLSKGKGQVRRAAGNRLTSVRNQMDEFGTVSTERTAKAIDDEIARQTSPGKVANKAVIDELQKYKNALEEGQSFSMLDDWRTDFREDVKGAASLAGAGRTRTEAAMGRIYNAATKDLDDAIRSNVGERQAERFKDAKRIWAKEANELKKTRLKSVLDRGDVTPEVVGRILFGQMPSEQKALYRSLTNEGRQAARMTILNDVIEKASRRTGGLTPNSFATELGKRKEQIGTFFKGEERKQLEGMRRFLDATRRAQDAPVATQTGQQLMPILGIGGAAADLGITLGAGATLGTMARVYESAPVRNALLRLASAPPRGDAYDRALREASEAVRTSLLALEGAAQDTTGE